MALHKGTGNNEMKAGKPNENEKSVFLKSRSYTRNMLPTLIRTLYEGVSKSLRTGRLEQELKMVQLSGTCCSCVAIL